MPLGKRFLEAAAGRCVLKDERALQLDKREGIQAGGSG